MIYTVTLNPAIDKTVRIDGFAAGQVNRVESLREDAGGKGINVSKCLKALGAESVAAVVLAGQAGQHLQELLDREGLTVISAEVPGQTRTNLKIVDEAQGQNTDINEPGPLVNDEILEKFLARLCEKVVPGGLFILSGSLPGGASADTYLRWTEKLQSMGAKVILDADGACMAEGIKGKPCMVKPNETELSRLLGKPMDSLEALLAGGRELLAKGIETVVISLGGEGALFLWQDAVYRAKSLSVPVVSTVGAGDSVVAAFAYAMERNLSRRESIALAMAMGAASVMQTGSQAPDGETVKVLSRQVEIEKLP